MSVPTTRSPTKTHPSPATTRPILPHNRHTVSGSEDDMLRRYFNDRDWHADESRAQVAREHSPFHAHIPPRDLIWISRMSAPTAPRAYSRSAKFARARPHEGGGRGWAASSMGSSAVGTNSPTYQDLFEREDLCFERVRTSQKQGLG